MQCILSIVVPIHNMHQKLNQLNQWISTVPDTSVEVILVDDFTSEESSEEIEKLARFHSRLNMKLISGKFNSPGKARNAGLLEATGVWVIFADSDDTLYVEPVLNFLLKSNPINVEVFQFRELNFNSGKVLKPLSKTKSEIDLVISLGIWRIAFPRTFLINQKFSEMRMGEDLLFFLDVFEVNSEVHFNAIHGYDYLIGSGNQLTANKSAVSELPLLLGELAVRVETFNKVDTLARLSFFKNTLSLAKHLGPSRSYSYAWQTFLMFFFSPVKDKKELIRMIGKYCRP